MIKLFRKIRYNLMKKGKTTKSLKDAIGEIILVVIGILIALQVNNWNTNRVDNSNEEKILLELKKGLQLDKEKMEVQLVKCKQAVRQMKKLQQLLQDKTYPYSKSLDSLFGEVYGIRKVFLNRAFYEDLKATSLRIIKNDDIRLQIVQLFEENYVEMRDVFSVAEPSINEVTRPYYLQNFNNIKLWTSATPNNFESVWKDTYYENIVAYRILSLEVNQLDVYSKTIPVIQKLVDDINSYLE